VERSNTGDPEPVAICRLKRVAADLKEDVRGRMPQRAPANGKRIACIGAGPASLTVARDLAPLGYEVTVFDGEQLAGGFMRTQIPHFRLPESVIDEETGYVLDLGVQFVAGQRIASMNALMRQGYDAIFVGCGAPRGRNLDLPGRAEAAGQIHIGIDWLASVSFGHVTDIGRRVIVLGGGNTAMDCCRSARRLGGTDVKVIVRSGFEEMKASPWEKEDAMHEGIPIINCHVPKAFVHENGRLTGMSFEVVRAEYDAQGRRKLVPTGEPDPFFPCDEVLVAVGQENAFPWIEPDCGIAFDRWGLPQLDKATYQSSVPNVFFGGDAALGPKNIITAVAHGHEAAISIDRLLHGEDLRARPAPTVNLMSQKMGIHEWSYDNETSLETRFRVPWAQAEKALASIRVEVELGFDAQTAFREAQRCLNCDVQTVFNQSTCIECDACVDICPMDCISFTADADEPELRQRLKAPALNLAQDLYVSGQLKTGRVMVKDEDVCLHCGLCAERCPTGAWDMQKFLFKSAVAGFRAVRPEPVEGLRPAPPERKGAVA
jgi:NADPH-dependent glutamate synthase beta subunit-like oxidoreductase/formate hydrogenlyase subunit 6/NADH:ubiquinone oxidoreductase subunit I